jgi:hypothetical protein
LEEGGATYTDSGIHYHRSSLSSGDVKLKKGHMDLITMQKTRVGTFVWAGTDNIAKSFTI